MTHSDWHSTPAERDAPGGSEAHSAAQASTPAQNPSMDARLHGLPVRATRLIRSARQAIENERIGEAEQLLARAQPFAGSHPEFLRLLGVTHILQKRAGEAATVLRRALDLQPSDPLIMVNFGSALREAGQLEIATVLLRRACEIAPDLAAAWANLGAALAAHAEIGEALQAYQRALERDPDHITARIGYANALKNTGQMREAAVEYRTVLAKQPRMIGAWLGLSHIKSVKLTGEELAQLQALFTNAAVDEQNRLMTGFALARALEDHERYTEAFAVLCAANAIKRRQVEWDAAKFSAHVAAIARAFSKPSATAADPDQGSEVIFVVSLPHSASALTEQILAAHPDVDGANESTGLDAVIEEESRRRQRAFPDWVGETSPADWKRLGQRYLERSARSRQSRPRFIDKGLSNWQYIGAAMAMLPGARFVNCRRDPVETCFACFRQLFARGHAFTYDIGDLTAYWREYDHLMRYWHARYPHRVYDQVYENLLADPQTQTRRLLDFCGLPFHAGERVMRKAYAARARKYGALLAPLRQALGL